MNVLEKLDRFLSENILPHETKLKHARRNLLTFHYRRYYHFYRFGHIFPVCLCENYSLMSKMRMQWMLMMSKEIMMPVAIVSTE